MKDANSESADQMPVLDDGWWESVLAEESSSSPHPFAAPEHSAEAAPGTPPESVHRVPVDWPRVRELFDRDQVVALVVTAANRGGLLVEGDGLTGFVPYSHLVDVQPAGATGERDRFLAAYAGRTLQLKVIECTPQDGRVIFSERAALAGPGKRSQLFRSLHVGDRVSGRVTNITDFGVFVDLGGVEGLIHISELSWGRVSHPGQIVQLGQVLETQVLELSAERSRVALSLKRLLPNPWLNIEKQLAPGQVLPAEVTSVLSYGAFARLDLGVEGLIHASELPVEAGGAAQAYLHAGQKVQVRILLLDVFHQRIGLSMRV
jgi:small subunit ribosomal protein S1